MLSRYSAGKCFKIIFGNGNLKHIHPPTGLLDQSQTFFAHSSRAYLHQDKNERPMPTAYYYQNPFQWMKIKWQLIKMKNYDKDFNVEEFKRGSKQALSTITNIVRDERLDDLEGLLTPLASAKLRRDMLVWNDEILRNIGVKLSDIKLAIPTRVNIRTIQLLNTRLCDIDMWYMAMKWKNLDDLIITDFVARFSRDITHNHYNSDWTISFFELRKYYLQSYSN